MTFTPQPPVERLPLAARKSIRDNFEDIRSGYEEKITAIMGESWIVEVNANEVFAYSTSGTSTNDPGSCFADYFEPFIKNLSEFTTKYGDDGKNELNSVVSAHKVILAVDDIEKQNYCGSDIKEGILRLIFHADKLGMFPSDSSNDLVGALKAAPPVKGSMNLVARNGIKSDYEAGVEAVRAEIAKIVATPDLKLSPNFEYNYGKLTAMGSSAPSDWDVKLGKATLEYFVGVKKILEDQGFGKDDMLQEGFQEAIDKNEITLKIVDVLACGGSYNEVITEGGVLTVQTLPSQWGSWTGEAANRLTDML